MAQTCKLMSPLVHRVYVYTMAAIVVAVTLVLAYKGLSYYSTSFEERFYHPDHDYFKPSGMFGHGLGIVGTLLILVGVTMYIARKRVKVMARWGRLKYWLEFHIFLCSLGPVMVLFHTAFKFGGIVSIAFWSMVAVVASGVVGRFIYIQIPRTIEGRMLSLSEIQGMKINLSEILQASYQLAPANYRAIVESVNAPYYPQGNNLLDDWVKKYMADVNLLRSVRTDLQQQGFSKQDIRQVTQLVRSELTLNNRIARLQLMQKLFRYWHVAHLPFALIMLIIVLLHIGVTLALGYTWIF